MAKRKSSILDSRDPVSVTDSKPGKKQRQSVTGIKSVNEIARIEAAILASPTNYNSIAQLLDGLKKSIASDLLSEDDEEDNEINVALITSLFRIFGKLLKKGELRGSKSFTPAQAEVVLWLGKKYDAFKSQLYDIIKTNESDTLQVLALQISMRMFKLENLYYVPNETFFPKDILANTIEAVYFSREGSTPLLEEFMDNFVMAFDDVRYHFLSVSADVLNDSEALRSCDQAQLASERLFNNLITIGETFPESDEEITEFFLKAPRAPKAHVSSPRLVSSHKIMYQKALLASFRLPITEDQYKSILTVLHKSVIPNMAQPQFLMDFLSDAYNAGGPVALLALNGLFSLIQTYNLDYPKFFEKLYSLLDSSILHVKYRSRFLRLLDLFLTSTHISATVVASFVKRISRLALFAPPSAIVAVVPFVYNQLKRHPTCMALIHRPDYVVNKKSGGFLDPFDENQSDPLLTNAIDSSLWELESLQSHYHPNVATLARIMSEQFRKPQYVLEDFLDMSYSSLMSAEQNRKLKKAPALEFEKFEQVFEVSTEDLEDAALQPAFMVGWMY